MEKIKKEQVFVSDSIKIVRLGVPAGASVPEHHANVDVIATIVRGEGNFTVEGQARAVRAGDVVTMHPRQRHAITADTDLEIVVVHARVTPAGEPPACGA